MREEIEELKANHGSHLPPPPPPDNVVPITAARAEELSVEAGKERVARARIENDRAWRNYNSGGITIAPAFPLPDR